MVTIWKSVYYFEDGKLKEGYLSIFVKKSLEIP